MFKNLATFLFLFPFITGCFISDSINNSSDSISRSSDSVASISRSIKSVSRSISKVFTSSSKGKEPKKVSYQNDIRETTRMHIQAGMDEEAFRFDIRRIAHKNGILNWESDSVTYEGIGQGLKKAGITPDELESLKTSLGKSSPVIASLQQGYQSL